MYQLGEEKALNKSAKYLYFSAKGKEVPGVEPPIALQRAVFNHILIEPLDHP
jgi:hypothetical protein